jgi:hypothetical protein
MAEATTSLPFRMRFAAPLTALPAVAFIAAAAPLLTLHADIAFFTTAGHVLAIGGVALAIEGRFFRLRPHIGGARSAGSVYAIVNVVTILVAQGVGLGFAFAALVRGESHAPELAMVSGALASQVAAFAVQALFGTPGTAEEED